MSQNGETKKSNILEIFAKAIPVGPSGFVRLVDVMGDDSAIVQAARISYGAGTTTTLSDRELIRYLVRKRHTTPLEMCEIKFHLRLPMDTMRQLVRHRTSNINEYCVDPTTLILKTDLTWVPAGTLQIGDKLVGFNEKPSSAGLVRGNKLTTSLVTNNDRILAPCYAVTTDNGATAIVSENHGWIKKNQNIAYRWETTGNLVVGDLVAYTTSPWVVDHSYEAGWLSGIYDGEGWLSASNPAKAANGATSWNLHLGVAQREGSTLERIRKSLSDRDIPYIEYIQNKNRTPNSRPCWSLATQQKWQIYRLLGSIRPRRLLEQTNIIEGQAIAARTAKITKIEFLGIREVVALGTTTKTYIANGYLAHNSTRYSIAIDATANTGPTEWRGQSTNNKQGSEGFITEWPEDCLFIVDDLSPGEFLSIREEELQSFARAIYEERLDLGVAREQARKDLPLSTYTELYWKIDLHNLLNFLFLRIAPDAQQEIREFANAIGTVVESWVPHAWEAFRDYRLQSISFSKLELNVLVSHSYTIPALLDYLMGLANEERARNLIQYGLTSKSERIEFIHKLKRITEISNARNNCVVK